MIVMIVLCQTPTHWRGMYMRLTVTQQQPRLSTDSRSIWKEKLKVKVLLKSSSSSFFLDLI